MICAQITEGVTALLKEHYGHGPERARSYYVDDLVVCLLRGGFTRMEKTLMAGGAGPAVTKQRAIFQTVMRPFFIDVVEAATGRKVVGFTSGSDQDPDIASEVFVLEPNGSRGRRESVIA